ncbi:MAG: hypothetical protein SNI42_03835 [Rikenellaceae bacterium]
MDITRIICDYMKANRRLTVPGLGSFLSREDEDEVLFSEFLKMDDGVLKGLLAAKHKVTEAEALVEIEKFSKEVVEAFDRGHGTLELDHLGVFTIHANSLDFDFDPSVRTGDEQLRDSVKVEQQRKDAERKAQEEKEAKAEAERKEKERLEAERKEQERLAAERAEAARIEAERLEAERKEQERLEAERKEQERLEAERAEAARIEAERLEAECKEQERLEAERKKQERLEAERIEAERIEAERIEAENAEAARIEAERRAAEEREAEEAQRIQAERIAAELKEQERLRAERQAKVEQERKEQEESDRLMAERRYADLKRLAECEKSSLPATASDATIIERFKLRCNDVKQDLVTVYEGYREFDINEILEERGYELRVDPLLVFMGFACVLALSSLIYGFAVSWLVGEITLPEPFDSIMAFIML